MDKEADKIKPKFVFALLLMLSFFVIINLSLVNAITVNLTDDNNDSLNNSYQDVNGSYQLDNQSQNSSNGYQAAAGEAKNNIYTRDQIINASIWVKNQTDVNHKFPDSVTINGNQMDMYSFLYLLSFVVQNIYNNNNINMDTKIFNGPESNNDDVRTGSMSINEYIHIADIAKVYMDRTGYVPGYAYGTSLGTYFGWKTMIYNFCSVLAIYNDTKSLPASIGVKPWRVVSDLNVATFTRDQVVSAAVNLKTVIDDTHQLPSTVTVGNKQVDMYSFLYLLSFVVQNIYNNNNINMDTWTFKGPESNNDDVRTGSMSINEYIHIADIAKVYMDRTGYVPGYAYGTSLGTYFGWKTMIYTFCNVLASYNDPKSLPTSIGVKPWRVVSDLNVATFTRDQVVSAAVNLKTVIDDTHQLPSTVKVNGRDIGIYSFLYLLSFVVQNIYNNNNINMDTWTFNGPESNNDDVRAGNMGITEIVHIADIAKVYMDRTGYTPGYAYGTSLGTYFGWKTMIYTFCNVLASYNGHVLPSTITIEPWYGFTNNQVIDAATRVKNYVETKHTLPNTVDVRGTQISIYSFLYLLSTSVQNIYNKNNGLITAIICNGPQVQKEAIYGENMSLSEYIKIADQVKVYMDKTGIVPGYASGTSLGPALSWQNLVYTYSKILDSYNSTKMLPDSITIKPWILVTDPNRQVLRPVYITSDNIFGTSYDTNLVNSICQALMSMGVYAVNCGLGPNTHYSVLQNSGVPANALVIDIYGGACAGTIYEMGQNYYKQLVGSRKVFTIFICPPSWKITGLAWLPRAHDDDFSPSWFTGLSNPDQFLMSNGYNYFECPCDTSNPNNFSNLVNTMKNAIYIESLS